MERGGLVSLQFSNSENNFSSNYTLGCAQRASLRQAAHKRMDRPCKDRVSLLFSSLPLLSLSLSLSSFLSLRSIRGDKRESIDQSSSKSASLDPLCCGRLLINIDEGLHLIIDTVVELSSFSSEAFSIEMDDFASIVGACSPEPIRQVVGC